MLPADLTPEAIAARAAQRPFSAEELTELADAVPLSMLADAAHLVTVTCAPRRFSCCAVINAKSGRCTEDCRWCAQSRHWETGCETYPLLDREAALDAAGKAAAMGAEKVSFVTSGRKLSRNETKALAGHLAAVKAAFPIGRCASVGLMTADELAHLKAAGLECLHCNLETGPDFFAKVCTSHTQADKLKTIRAAQAAGLAVCSGCLFGLGEGREDRIALAVMLAGLGIRSIPMNFLNPITGTPLAGQPPLSPDEVTESVALMRLANPRAVLRFAGGRNLMSESTARRALYAGINGAITGTLLTTAASPLLTEKRLAKEAGYLTED